MAPLSRLRSPGASRTPPVRGKGQAHRFELHPLASVLLCLMWRTTGISPPVKNGKEVAMPVQSLPSNPSFENLRKQAKSLRQAVQKNEPGALAQVREFHPHPDEVNNKFALRDAQLVIARSYAFTSW